MPLHYSIRDRRLVIRIVGDNSMEEGRAGFLVGMQLAREAFEQTGERLHIEVDMRESTEKRSSEELRQMGHWFRPYLEYLTGRMAVIVTEELHFGMTRLFAAVSEPNGLEVLPFYDVEAARRWLRDGLPE